ncbi:polyphosphate kinase 1 [Wenzhouxiangella marina]|uniref:Polyphosphate kinase n=1 Tax=Wenzhouxiangella marina TaxID=1579979 RepID=A0A0K0XXN7_9GAMM|nr:polyphosphate kinase 1 [Wenzhouxiangella marina]AKS42397.1 polyphosphate kinase [Wenzhouxiangella marina]MBB6085829.1 polyphosphate kinase [Wenzhouxiangella marina]
MSASEPIIQLSSSTRLTSISEVRQQAAELSEWRQDRLDAPELYLNRELSLLAFTRRVLELARDETVPLLERLRFLCISCTNLDEFFEVRVASVRQRLQHGVLQPGPDGLSPTEALEAIRSAVLEMVAEQYRVMNEELTPALARQGIHILRRSEWSKKQRKWLHQHFRQELMPVLSPLGLDPAHPFPRILNKSLNFAVALEGRDAFGRDSGMALVRAPRSLPRIIRVPKSYSHGPNDFVFLSSILHAFIDELFPGMKVRGCYQFRVTRNSELFVDEEEIEDLARALEGELMERGFAEAVRLEVADNCPGDIARFLGSKFGIEDSDIYRCDGPVNLNRMSAICDLADRPDLKYPPYQPHTPKSLLPTANLFASLRRRDWILHHPYDSFQPVVDLMRQAASDPAVLAIKQTLYRTGVDSALVGLLIEAARAGKDVTVIVELRARFDEEANITLATRLQEAGVQVVYGVVGHKTHAKMMMIVRRERGRLHRYVHLGTGNYHQGTAKGYTDWSLMSADPDLCQDVHRIFQQLSGLGKVQALNKVVQSPFGLHDFLLERIERETEHARAGRPAAISAKMNSLTEPGIIQALYTASRAGVDIRLVVRGICCLRPGVPGLSETIRVRSILGRFLEHSRVYHFQNGDAPETWASSADWMERNLFQRVEVCFPICDPKASKRIVRESIELPFEDNLQAWELHADGSYHLLQPLGNDEPRSAQQALIEQYSHG